MSPDDFLAAVEAEQDLVEWVLGPPGKEEHVTEVYRGPWQIHEHGGKRVGHRLGAALSEGELDAFKRRFPGRELPADLLALLGRWNGIHLWADVDSGRAYEGLAPLQEWDLARRAMWGQDGAPESLADRYLALSYQADNSSFVVLDTESGRYFLMDSSGADESCPVGATANDVLEWLWDNRIPMPSPTNVWNDPRTAASPAPSR